MVSPFNAIGDGIASVSQSLSDNFTQNWQKFGQLLNYINPFHDDFFLSGLITTLIDNFQENFEKFGQLLNYINPFHDDFFLSGLITTLIDNFQENFEKFGQLLNYINPFHDDFFMSGLIEFLQNTFDPASDNFFLKVAFVPDMEEIEAKNDLLKQTISQKLGADTAIGKVQDLANNSGSAPDFQADLSVYGVGTFTSKVINIDWFETHKEKIFGWIRGFAYFVLVSINFNHIYKLMLGGAPILAGTMADSQNKGGQT